VKFYKISDQIRIKFQIWRGFEI